MSALISWYVFVIRYELRELYRSLPGPWYCKAALIVGCLAIPGPVDEIALIAFIAWRKRRRNRLGAWSLPSCVSWVLATCPIGHGNERSKQCLT
jgi:hypothetical protein